MPLLRDNLLPCGLMGAQTGDGCRARNLFHESSVTLLVSMSSETVILDVCQGGSFAAAFDFVSNVEDQGFGTVMLLSSREVAAADCEKCVAGSTFLLTTLPRDTEVFSNFFCNLSYSS